MNHLSTTKVQSSRKLRVCDGCLAKLGVGSSLVKIVHAEGRELFTTILCIPCDTFLEKNPDAEDDGWTRGDVGHWRQLAEEEEVEDEWVERQIDESIPKAGG